MNVLIPGVKLPFNDWKCLPVIYLLSEQGKVVDNISFDELEIVINEKLILESNNLDIISSGLGLQLSQKSELIETGPFSIKLTIPVWRQSTLLPRYRRSHFYIELVLGEGDVYIDCSYYSGSRYLKCAPNPAGPCQNCRFYESRLELNSGD